eukprot:scaffold9875_cov67-Phaeocystis_antarctica.AAC.4
MGDEAHGLRLFACGPGLRPGARWLHTCRRPVPSPRITCATPRRSNEDSGSSKRRPEHAIRAGTHGRPVGNPGEARRR